MNITVKGLNTGGPIEIDVQVDQSGETLPQVIINATGGKLDVYKSRVSLSGNVSVHLFGEEGST